MMTTIPSIDLMQLQGVADAAPQSLAETVSGVMCSGAAFQDAVARFRSAMGEVPQTQAAGRDVPVATPETLKAVVAENARIATELPQPVEVPPATPETLKAVVAENARIAEGLNGLKDKELKGSEIGGLKVAGVKIAREETPDVSSDETFSPLTPEPQNLSTVQPFNPLGFEAVQQIVADAKAPSVDAATARTQVLVDAVEAVCDTILVTPGLLRGQGEIRIQLKPEVLSGTEIRIEAKGTTLTVAFNPTTQDAATVIQQNIVQFEQHLAGRIHNYQIAARVNVGERKLKG